ncbi:MAG: hypothetical protein BWK77_02135 [Verrucomicrobia bacterium A1]|nr:MAG: hypothetical protein BWK77_02135 [Verrucomicrobia bacterium A1]
MASTPSSFTGRTRQRRTRWGVRFSDAFSRFLITVGGIGTVLSVMTVFLFLVYVVFPLLRPSAVGEPRSVAAAPAPSPVFFAMDEYGVLGVRALSDGTFRVFRLDDGADVARLAPFGDAPVTAAQFDPVHGTALFGFADGSARFVRCRFATKFAAAGEAPAALARLEAGRMAVHEGRAWQRISDAQFRSQGFEIELDAVLDAVHASPVRQIDFAEGPDGLAYAMFHEDGAFEVVRIARRKNIMTGETSVRKTVLPVPYKPRPIAGAPAFIALAGLGDAVSLAWADGHLQRYDVRAAAKIRLIEEVELLGDPSLRLTELRFLLGRFTLLAGDSSGRVRSWFVVNTDAGSTESTRLVASHAFAGPGGAPVTALASSARIRMFAAGYGDGSVRLYHVTSGKMLADLRLATPGEPVLAAAFAPKDDGFSAAGPSGYTSWPLDPRHPEATLPSLFTKVWYEGARAPEHVWQSSSGTDDFEPKLGLMPLVFGTLKATLFSLLFGVPIALAGAIFTSEFLNPRWKARIKPTVELMASLPSVVLGFLAALVFAPVVGGMLPAVLASFVTVPVTFLAGAYAWQLLPGRWTLRHGGLRLPLMLLGVPVGLACAGGLGAVLERWCFAGDIMRWLDGQIGRAAGGWFVVLFPLLAALVGWVGALTLNPRLRAVGRRLSRPACAGLDALKFVLLLAAAVAVSAATAFLLDGAGLDPRGTVLGTYVQRNALVVGFVMGFAIIPIIYTIADDALSAVPEHLRSASLGCGATAWQTATRIIVPTAASGLFSAVMIGLGRAVGETMIVLMAAGNTPVMEWNVFNGFRTLSANIAVELPEAVRNSTHYRTLFLAALVLFAMTFVLNTVAEIVRLRFRKRAFEL